MKNLCRFLLFVLVAALHGSDRPNILFIGVDDLRPELGCYGADHMVTPNIDRLATEGIRFDRAYTQQAVCLPARISLYAGQFPQTTGVTSLQEKFWKLHKDPLTLGKYLRRNGYHTIAMGKVLHDEQPREWDEWFNLEAASDVLKTKYASPENLKTLGTLEAEAKAKGLKGKAYRQYVRLGPTEQKWGPDENYHDFAMTDLAIAKIKTAAQGGKPFFLNVGYKKPHLPFVAPKRYWDLYDREALDLADNPSAPRDAPAIALMTWGELRAFKGVPKEGPVSVAMARELIHGYFACVSFVDDQIGRLLQAVDEAGLRDNTLVVLWSDHGWKLGEHGMWCKHTNYEIDTRIPLIFRLPSGANAGTISNELAQLVDLYPTLCALVGLEIPDHCEGRNLAFALDDPDARRAKAAYSEYKRHAGITGFSMKSGHLRYTEWVHLDSGETRVRELYDHAIDPDENLNRIDASAYAEQLPALAELLRQGPLSRIPAAN